jgi:hypothetical protein
MIDSSAPSPSAVRAESRAVLPLPVPSHTAPLATSAHAAPSLTKSDWSSYPFLKVLISDDNAGINAILKDQPCDQ